MAFSAFKTHRFSRTSSPPPPLPSPTGEGSGDPYAGIPAVRCRRLARPSTPARSGERALKARGQDTLLCLCQFRLLREFLFLSPSPFLSLSRVSERVRLARVLEQPGGKPGHSSVIRTDVFNGESHRGAVLNSRYRKVIRRYTDTRTDYGVYVRIYTARKLKRKSGHVEIFS